LKLDRAFAMTITVKGQEKKAGLYGAAGVSMKLAPVKGGGIASNSGLRLPLVGRLNDRFGGVPKPKATAKARRQAVSGGLVRRLERVEGGDIIKGRKRNYHVPENQD